MGIGTDRNRPQTRAGHRRNGQRHAGQRVQVQVSWHGGFHVQAGHPQAPEENSNQMVAGSRRR